MTAKSTLTAEIRDPADARDTRGAIGGTMMEIPLTITWLFEHMMRTHGAREIVSRLDDGSIVRLTYAEFGRRVARLANALVALGVRPGDRVASFAWNTHRHLELYYAVPMIGAVLHSANVRLFPEQTARVLTHAGDTFVFLDSSLVPAFARVAAAQPDASWRPVVMGPAHDKLPGALSYETLLEPQPPTFAWPTIDERSGAILCYTSATSGDPKGILYTHRSTYLHALTSALGDILGFRQRDCALILTPMFHANAWGIIFAAPMLGAKLALSGSRLDPKSVLEWIDAEEATVACGIPTLWIPLLEEVKRAGRRLGTLERVITGGLPCPPGLFDDFQALGVEVVHAWGMTELSPLGTTSPPHSSLRHASPERRREQRLKQGVFIPIVAWKLIDDDDNPVPADGVTRGELWSSRPGGDGELPPCETPRPLTSSATAGCVPATSAPSTRPGLHAGRRPLKDLIKSGGEWISSVDLENAIAAHPWVKTAVVVGDVFHPRCGRSDRSPSSSRTTGGLRRGRAAQVAPRTRREMDDPRPHLLRRRDPGHECREISQARAARTL